MSHFVFLSFSEVGMVGAGTAQASTGEQFIYIAYNYGTSADMDKSLVKVSKFLSYVLRHKPDAIGLELDTEGWAEVQDIIEKADTHITRTLIEQAVATNDKKRFALSDNGMQIRANQGHSVNIDLKLDPVEPPEFLYHGTAKRFLDSILCEGLKSKNRQHVHLSLDEYTARKVGQRHGKPVILKIPALQMHKEGHEFFIAKNGVWLTKKINSKWLTVYHTL